MLYAQLAQPLQCGVAQGAGAEGGAHHRAIQCADHIAARVAAHDFAHHIVGDLLGSDELHLAVSGDGGEVAGCEKPVFAGINVHGFQLFAGGFAELALRFQVAHVLDRQSLIGRAIVEQEILPAAADRSVADFFPRDQRGGLDLFDHFRPAGSARHQESEQRLCAGQRGLGHQHPGWFFLAVGVGNVKAHAAGAAGAYFDVGLRIGAQHGFVEDLDMAHELGNIQSGQKMFNFFRPLGAPVAFSDQALQFARPGIDILISHRRGGVNAIDNDLGGGAVQSFRLALNDLIQKRCFQDFVVEFVDDVAYQAFAFGGVGHDGRARAIFLSLPLRAQEYVPPGGEELRFALGKLRLERRHGLFGFLLAERGHDQPRRFVSQ